MFRRLRAGASTALKNKKKVINASQKVCKFDNFYSVLGLHAFVMASKLCRVLVNPDILGANLVYHWKTDT